MVIAVATIPWTLGLARARQLDENVFPSGFARRVILNCKTLLLDQCDNILGRSFCALGDGATSPISSSIKFFRDEYLAHLTHGGCPFDPAASTAWAATTAGAKA